MNRRVFLFVLDSFGIGEMPDANLFRDSGANTLKSISKSDKFNISTLRSLGLCNIDSINYLDSVYKPTAAHCRLGELSNGKDTTIGHWEISGIVSEKPLVTYPNGFPDEIINEFSKRTGKNILCNKPYSGTDVIRDYGDEHIKTGNLIVYTSSDSVFQIAAHEDVVPLNELYSYCKIARDILTGEFSVGRVIARPFIGSSGNYKRTENRHDFSIAPPEKTMLNYLCECNKDTIAVGKINDIFCNNGISEYVYTKNNSDGMNKADLYVQKDFDGLCFVNFVDFDMLYGHRNNIDGYANAITELDKWLNTFINKLKNDDILIITADHGCDPGFINSTDHTREYVPMMIYGEHIKPINMGTRFGFCDIAKTICEYFNIENTLAGNSFLGDVYGK